MPRNVRNFWVTAEVKGRSSEVSFGPVSKRGGIFMLIRMRNDGQVGPAMTIHGRVEVDGAIVLTAETPDGQSIRMETRR